MPLSLRQFLSPPSDRLLLETQRAICRSEQQVEQMIRALQDQPRAGRYPGRIEMMLRQEQALLAELHALRAELLARSDAAAPEAPRTLH